MKKPYILIPSLNPDENLVDYIKALQERGFHDILVVDDGSRDECQFIFDAIRGLEGCCVFRHAMNLGKGRALKSGFNYFLQLKNSSEYSGIITVDSDGQHSVEDVEKIADSFVLHSKKLILGCRDFFSGAKIPLKSCLGNRLTCVIFRLLYGIKLKDTQTGLRGIPSSMLRDFIRLFGEGFEYEMNILIQSAERGIPIYEVDIQTIYMNKNRASHFKPLRDSWSIYSLIFKSFFRYMGASLLSFVIDIGLFHFFLILLKFLEMNATAIVWATFGARIFSSFFNYTVNKKLVFQSCSSKRALLRYYLLCICQMMVSAGAVALIYRITQTPETFIKILVDAILFYISYQVQRQWVFCTPCSSKR